LTGTRTFMPKPFFSRFRAARSRANARPFAEWRHCPRKNGTNGILPVA
jgi:hypothetical protein